MCAWGEDQKRCQLAVEASRDGVENVLQAYRKPLANIILLKYLIRLIFSMEYY